MLRILKTQNLGWVLRSFCAEVLIYFKVGINKLVNRVHAVFLAKIVICLEF